MIYHTWWANRDLRLANNSKYKFFIRNSFKLFFANSKTKIFII